MNNKLTNKNCIMPIEKENKLILFLNFVTVYIDRLILENKRGTHCNNYKKRKGIVQ